MAKRFNPSDVPASTSAAAAPVQPDAPAPAAAVVEQAPAPAHAPVPAPAPVVPADLIATRNALAACEDAYTAASAAYKAVSEAAEKSQREFRARISDATAAVDRAKLAWIEAAPQLKAVNAEIAALGG